MALTAHIILHNVEVYNDQEWQPEVRLEVVEAYLILLFTGKKELQKEIQMGSRQVYYRKQREGLAVHCEVRTSEVCP